MYQFVIFVLLLGNVTCACLNNFKQKSHSKWKEGGQWKIRADVSPDIVGFLTDWKVEIVFAAPLAKDIEVWVANGAGWTNGKSSIVLTPKSYNRRISDRFALSYTATFDQDLGSNHIKCLQFCGKLSQTGKQTCATGTLPSKSPTTTNKGSCSGSYNYKEALEKSILFYEAQRSGKLPSDQRVKWRKDSALKDGSDVGLDLSGGYYDAGDYVKFGFPMASTITVLAWGMLDFKDGYKRAGQYDHGLKTLKWGTDYFINCHTSKYEFYGQVGEGDLDHAFWGRPEEMTMKRTSFKIDTKNPGSDLAAETAAALTASSLVFRESGDTAYADKLLRHGKDLYEFATKYRRAYHLSIKDAQKFYKSYSGFKDELAWASLWLYKATRDKSYANAYLQEFDQEVYSIGVGEFSWDNKWMGAKVLASQLKITGKDYLRSLKTLLQSSKKTPKGLFFVMKWGSNRHAANLAFLSLVASRIKDAAFYEKFAREQLNYMLGDSGRSYVVGFGMHPPQRPHHASSSCPLYGKCDWSNFNSPKRNPITLYGALVGGPDQNDLYKDERDEYVQNEVTCDYNAGFQSALAGLIQLGKC